MLKTDKQLETLIYNQMIDRNNKYIIFSAFLMLIATTSCSNMEESTREFRYKVDDSYDDFRYKISNLLYDRDELPPSPEPPRPYYKASYCYQVSSDVMCYRQPREDLRGRFIGMQGDDGSYYADTPIYDYGVTQDISSYNEGYKAKNQTINRNKNLDNLTKNDIDNSPIELMDSF